MDGFGNFISMLDFVLDTKKKTSHYRGHFIKCLFTFWWSRAYCNDY